MLEKKMEDSEEKSSHMQAENETQDPVKKKNDLSKNNLEAKRESLKGLVKKFPTFLLRSLL